MSRRTRTKTRGYKSQNERRLGALARLEAQTPRMKETQQWQVHRRNLRKKLRLPEDS